MASTTPKNQRKRLTNDEKQKIIEDSKKPGFCRKKVMEKYGISRSAISVLLAKQKDILKKMDSSVLVSIFWIEYTIYCHHQAYYEGKE